MQQSTLTNNITLDSLNDLINTINTEEKAGDNTRPQLITRGNKKI